MSTEVLAPLSYTKQEHSQNQQSVSYSELFKAWFTITDEQKNLANQFADEFYFAVRLIDDVQDNTLTRNGKPTANAVYGSPLAINAGMIATVQLMKRVNQFKNDKVIDLFIEEFTLMWEGQGQQLQWTSCPSLAEVIQMSEKKGVLASLFGRMLCALSGNNDAQYLNLFRNLNVLLQIENDIDGTSTLRDITEGQYNFVTTFAILKEKELHGTNRLEQILLSKTSDAAVLNEARNILVETQAFEYSITFKNKLITEIVNEVKLIGNNTFCEEILIRYGVKNLKAWARAW
jgi:geranylgeranyl pyrophosphate synthase